MADTEPHAEPGEAERATLTDLAALVMDEIARDAEVAAAHEQSLFDQERVDLALSAAGLAAFEWDTSAESVVLSEPLRAMIGWDAARGASTDWQSLRAIMHPDDRDRPSWPVREQPRRQRPLPGRAAR